MKKSYEKINYQKIVLKTVQDLLLLLSLLLLAIAYF